QRESHHGSPFIPAGPCKYAKSGASTFPPTDRFRWRSGDRRSQAFERSLLPEQLDRLEERRGRGAAGDRAPDGHERVLRGQPEVGLQLADHPLDLLVRPLLDGLEAGRRLAEEIGPFGPEPHSRALVRVDGRLEQKPDLAGALGDGLHALLDHGNGPRYDPRY